MVQFMDYLQALDQCMSPLVNGFIEAMLNKVSKITCDKNTEINIYELYKRLTMDVICN
jgi:hypothetical protein